MARMAANAIAVGRQRDLAPRWVNRCNLESSKDEIYQTPLPENAIHLEGSKLYLQQNPPGGSLALPSPGIPLPRHYSASPDTFELPVGKITSLIEPSSLTNSNSDDAR